MRHKISMTICIVLIIVSFVVGAGIMVIIQNKKLSNTKTDISTTKPCVNYLLGNMEISYSDMPKSVIMKYIKDFKISFYDSTLKVDNLNQLLKIYNKDILLADPSCSQQLLKLDNQGISYIYADVSTDIVLDKCWDKEYVDLDKDGKDEQIITATIAMTQSPHVSAILKDGKLVAAYEGGSIIISPLELSDSDKGFYVQTGDSMHQNKIRVKYTFTENGDVVPMWQEAYCN